MENYDEGAVLGNGEKFDDDVVDADELFDDLDEEPDD